LLDTPSFVELIQWAFGDSDDGSEYRIHRDEAAHLKSLSSALYCGDGSTFRGDTGGIAETFKVKGTLLFSQKQQQQSAVCVKVVQADTEPMDTEPKGVQADTVEGGQEPPESGTGTPQRQRVEATAAAAAAVASEVHGRAAGLSMPEDETVSAATTASKAGFAQIRGLALINDSNDYGRGLTYGEILPEAMETVIFRMLPLGPSDVFYDLGSGTGKICLQAALQTNAGRSVGIEISQSRSEVGIAALERLRTGTPPQCYPGLCNHSAGGNDDTEAEGNAKTMQKKVAGSASMLPKLVSEGRLELITGDITQSLLFDATAVFVNNVCFPDTLMNWLVSVLATLPKLTRFVSMRKLCGRCGPACAKRGRPCAQYRLLWEQQIAVTWCKGAPCYLYEVVRQ
jgi:hypothetical protein